VPESLAQVRAIILWEGEKEESHPRIYTLTWVSQASCERLVLDEQLVLVSYLPLHTVSVQLTDLWIPLCCGGTTYFAEEDALKGSLIPTLQEVQPTWFVGPNHFWEKIRSIWTALEHKARLLPRMIIGWARGIGLKAFQNVRPGSVPWGYSLAKKLVFQPARAALGLGRCRLGSFGTEPVNLDTLEYYGSLDLLILARYGVNESCGIHSVALPNAWKKRSSGLEIPGCKTRLQEPLSQGSGQLCLWGRHIFMGYLGMEKETQAALDENGWLLTGALGRTDKDGFLYVTERGEGSHIRTFSTGETPRRLQTEDLYMEI
ncbi:hypothetical protein GDO86_018327, partial [Hymenochirus boettgeri]